MLGYINTNTWKSFYFKFNGVLATIDPFIETKIQDALQMTIKRHTSVINTNILWTLGRVNRNIVLNFEKILREGYLDKLIAKSKI